MTRYILENIESRGTYYVSCTEPLGQRPVVKITQRQELAPGFDSMTQAYLIAAQIPGRWQAVAV